MKISPNIEVIGNPVTGTLSKVTVYTHEKHWRGELGVGLIISKGKPLTSSIVSQKVRELCEAGME
ncbi:MAG: hypothetical protein KAQ93_01045 [Spirochaetales bacterium]|nr:hypothetical protein [Spirochaetales bacterium]